MLNMFEEFFDDQGILRFKTMWTEVKRDVLKEAGATDLAGRCDTTLLQRKLPPFACFANHLPSRCSSLNKTKLSIS